MTVMPLFCGARVLALRFLGVHSARSLLALKGLLYV